MIADDPFVRAYQIGGIVRMPENLGVSFERYAAFRSTVAVRDEDGVHGWLRTCRYVPDREFGREDVWMHPEDFERLRAGDCEEHAIWAWGQFVRLGRDARFVAGFHKGEGHAWVTLHAGDAVRVFEATEKREGYRAESSHACPQYRPIWSVDGALRFRWHGPRDEIPRLPT